MLISLTNKLFQSRHILVIRFYSYICNIVSYTGYFLTVQPKLYFLFILHLKCVCFAPVYGLVKRPAPQQCTIIILKFYALNLQLICAACCSCSCNRSRSGLSTGFRMLFNLAKTQAQQSCWSFVHT